jgi:hypothetical protein
MSDTSFCSGEHKVEGVCPKRDSCKRYLLSLDRNNHSIHQSWIGTAFVRKLSGISCDYYLNIRYD